MEFTTDWQYLISSSWRIFFICMASAFQVTWITQKFLSPKKSSFPILLFFFIRTIILYIGFQVILAYFYKSSSWFMTAFNSVSMLFVIVMYLTLNYTYEGDLLKVIWGSSLSEIVAIFPFHLSLAAVNFLNGIKDPVYLYGERTLIRKQ